MSDRDPLLELLSRFAGEGVEYVLVGGHAVRLNGYLRATEDVDVLVRASRENGERIIRALRFLDSSRELDPAWFDREKALLDKRVLARIRKQMEGGEP